MTYEYRVKGKGRVRKSHSQRREMKYFPLALPGSQDATPLPPRR